MPTPTRPRLNPPNVVVRPLTIALLLSHTSAWSQTTTTTPQGCIKDNGTVNSASTALVSDAQPQGVCVETISHSSPRRLRGFDLSKLSWASAENVTQLRIRWSKIRDCHQAEASAWPEIDPDDDGAFVPDPVGTTCFELTSKSSDNVVLVDLRGKRATDELLQYAKHRKRHRTERFEHDARHVCESMFDALTEISAKSQFTKHIITGSNWEALSTGVSGLVNPFSHSNFDDNLLEEALKQLKQEEKPLFNFFSETLRIATESILPAPNALGTLLSPTIGNVVASLGTLVEQLRKKHTNDNDRQRPLKTIDDVLRQVRGTVPLIDAFEESSRQMAWTANAADRSLEQDWQAIRNALEPPSTRGEDLGHRTKSRTIQVDEIDAVRSTFVRVYFADYLELSPKSTTVDPNEVSCGLELDSTESLDDVRLLNMSSKVDELGEVLASQERLRDQNQAGACQAFRDHMGSYEHLFEEIDTVEDSGFEDNLQRAKKAFNGILGHEHVKKHCPMHASEGATDTDGSAGGTL